MIKSIFNQINKTLFGSASTDKQYQYSSNAPDKYLSFQKTAKAKQKLFIPDNRESYVKELWRLFVEECLSGNDEDVQALYKFIESFDKGACESLEIKYIKLGLKNYIGNYMFVKEIKGGYIIAKSAEKGEILVLNKFKLIRQGMKNEYTKDKDLCKQVLDKLNFISPKWVKGRSAFLKSFEGFAACERAIKRFEAKHGKIADICLENFEEVGRVVVSGGKSSGGEIVDRKFGNIVGGAAYGIFNTLIQTPDAVTNPPGLLAAPLNAASPDEVSAAIETFKNTKDEGKKTANISSALTTLFLLKKAPKYLKSKGKVKAVGVIAREVEAAKAFKHINSVPSRFAPAKKFVTAGKKPKGMSSPLRLAFAPRLAGSGGGRKAPPSKETQSLVTPSSASKKLSGNILFSAGRSKELSFRQIRTQFVLEMLQNDGKIEVAGSAVGLDKAQLREVLDDITTHQEVRVRIVDTLRARHGYKDITQSRILAMCEETPASKSSALRTQSPEEFLRTTTDNDLLKNTVMTTQKRERLEIILGRKDVPAEVRDIAEGRLAKLEKPGAPAGKQESGAPRPHTTKSTFSDYLAQETNDPAKLQAIRDNPGSSPKAKKIAQGKLDAIEKAKELEQKKLDAKNRAEACKQKKLERERAKAEKTEARKQKKLAEKLAKANAKAEKVEARKQKKLAKKQAKAEKAKTGKKPGSTKKSSATAKQASASKRVRSFRRSVERTVSVTDVDLNILEKLINNRKLTLTAIADKYGLIGSSISRTIKKMKSASKAIIKERLSKRLGREVSTKEIDEIIAPRKRGAPRKIKDKAVKKPPGSKLAGKIEKTAQKVKASKKSSAAVRPAPASSSVPKQASKTAGAVLKRAGREKFSDNDILPALLKTDGDQMKAVNELKPAQTKTESFQVTICRRAKKIRELSQKELEKYAKKFRVTVNKIRAICGDKDAINIETLKAFRKANYDIAAAAKKLKKGRSTVWGDLSTIKKSTEKHAQYAKELGIPLKELKKLLKIK